jgi:hypothetical protein
MAKGLNGYAWSTTREQSCFWALQARSFIAEQAGIVTLPTSVIIS